MLLSFLVYHLMLACYRFTGIVLHKFLKMTSMVKLPAKENVSVEKQEWPASNGRPRQGADIRKDQIGRKGKKIKDKKLTFSFCFGLRIKLTNWDLRTVLAHKQICPAATGPRRSPLLMYRLPGGTLYLHLQSCRTPYMERPSTSPKFKQPNLQLVDRRVAPRQHICHFKGDVG